MPPLRVRRLETFGSVARQADFDPAKSDIDLLVEFAVEEGDFGRFADFKEALEALLDRRIDLVDRKAVEKSRNYIRKKHILAGAEPIYATSRTMPPTFLMFLWIVLGLPSLLAGFVLGVLAVYGRRLWRLYRRRSFVRKRFNQEQV